MGDRALLEAMLKGDLDEARRPAEHKLHQKFVEKYTVLGRDRP